MSTRQEALRLSGLSSGKLSRLDKSGLVRPTKIGDATHPAVIYSQDQVVELKIVAELSDILTMKEIRAVLESIRDLGISRCLGRYLILHTGQVHWVQPSQSLLEFVSDIGGKRSVTLKIIPPIREIID